MRNTEERASSPGALRRLLWLGLSLTIGLAACTQADAAPAAEHRDDDCFLGLDLWDTDPALTWIADGRVWVRTGDHQACLSVTDAQVLEWSPDGRRLLLDDELVDPAADTAVEVPGAGQVLWQQPFGETAFALAGNAFLAFGAADDTVLPAEITSAASHPDAAHYAVAHPSGVVALHDTNARRVIDLLQLDPAERIRQMTFSADGSRLWVLTSNGTSSNARYVDLLPISSFLDIPPVESMVPQTVPPGPDLYYIDPELAAASPQLPTGSGATGTDITRFVLHPSHPGWIAVTEGSCDDAQSKLFINGEAYASEMPGAVVGFFRGHGLPVLATTTAGCGSGSLWVIEDLPTRATANLIADNVDSADIRDEAPDPWNPNAAPPFA